MKLEYERGARKKRMRKRETCSFLGDTEKELPCEVHPKF